MAKALALAYPPGVATLEQAFGAHRGRLWGLCYRMSGCAADADDWLQDAFERALSQPPTDLTADVGPWLTRVTMNVCRDQLRRRRHRAYAGPWLPGPIETSELWAKLEGEPSPDVRYGRLESVSLAFLHALEVLTPNQRAVLVMRDVCDLSVQETAQALSLGEASVKTLHHRARAALAGHDARGSVRDPAAQKRLLEAFLVHLALGNVEALSALVGTEIVELHDGAGKYAAAQRPIRGLDKLLTFHRKTKRPVVRALACSLNGQPALLFELAPRRPREPVRGAMWLSVDAEGRVEQVFAQVADRKLAGLPWSRARRVDMALVLGALRSAWTTPSQVSWRRRALRRALGEVATFVRGLPRQASQRRRRAARQRR